MTRIARRRFLVLSLAATSVLAGCARSSTASTPPGVGPERGSLLVVGGGRMGPEIVEKFVALAGGPSAPIVVIPTAVGDTLYPRDWSGANFLREAGVKDIVILHTKDRNEANSERFVAPIRRARAVWFPGGRQWRLADAYLGTRTERELHELLARGGVIGGTSAGASIQASYLIRGAVEGNTVVMAPGHEKGFGFLRQTAVDQHVLARQRLADLPKVLAAYPELLGIGIDEGTAIVVQRDQFEVIGASKVFVYGGRDVTDSASAYKSLRPGDRYDLRSRRVVTSADR